MPSVMGQIQTLVDRSRKIKKFNACKRFFNAQLSMLNPRIRQQMRGVSAKDFENLVFCACGQNGMGTTGCALAELTLASKESIQKMVN